MFFKDFDNQFFKFLECFVFEFGDSSFFKLFGADQWQLLAMVQEMKRGYDANFVDEDLKDIGYWVDFADIIFQELAIMDGEDMLYKFYKTLLKIRSFLLRIEPKINPIYEQIEDLVLELYSWLLQNLSRVVIPILKTLQDDTFWDAGHLNKVFITMH